MGTRASPADQPNMIIARNSIPPFVNAPKGCPLIEAKRPDGIEPSVNQAPCGAVSFIVVTAGKGLPAATGSFARSRDGYPPRSGLLDL